MAARRRRTLLFAVGFGVLVAVAIAAGALLLSSSSVDERQALEDAGCTLESFPGQEGAHTANLNDKPKWNSDPPTSGRHYFDPAIWGIYDEPVALIQSVHNLEHGGIVVHYGSEVSDATVSEIEGWYHEDPNGLLVSPLPSLRPRDAIALTAWTAEPNERGRGYLAKCTRFDEKAFSTFRDEHRYQGPERFTPEQVEPGT